MSERRIRDLAGLAALLMLATLLVACETAKARTAFRRIPSGDIEVLYDPCRATATLAEMSIEDDGKTLWKLEAEGITRLSGRIQVVIGQPPPGFQETVALPGPVAGVVLVLVRFSDGSLDSAELIAPAIPSDGTLMFEGKPIDEDAFWARDTCDG